jgi:hypothetical protein
MTAAAWSRVSDLVGVSASDLKALLGHYDIVDEAQVTDLLALARAGRERPWQSVYGDVVSPRMLQFIEFEAAASISRNFQPLLVPGLLQTEEYARTIFRQFSGTSRTNSGGQVQATRGYPRPPGGIGLPSAYGVVRLGPRSYARWAALLWTCLTAPRIIGVARWIDRLTRCPGP